jgi:hypothetical protein
MSPSFAGLRRCGGNRFFVGFRADSHSPPAPTSFDWATTHRSDKYRQAGLRSTSVTLSEADSIALNDPKLARRVSVLQNGRDPSNVRNHRLCPGLSVAAR